jgi:hypothetical protein
MVSTVSVHSSEQSPLARPHSYEIVEKSPQQWFEGNIDNQNLRPVTHKVQDPSTLNPKTSSEEQPWLPIDFISFQWRV